MSDPQGGAVDLRARVAWLARVSRCASSDPEATKQVAFADRMRAVGVSASSTKVSLWENAHQPMTLAVLAGYEKVLDLAPGQLQATCEGLSRSISASGRPSLQRARALGGGQQLLDTVYDAASRHATTGGDWFALTSYWDHMSDTMIPIAIVRSLTATLLSEMVRSCGTAYVTRYQALCHLADHPVYAQVLVDTILDFIAVPGVEPVIDAISLMGEGLAEQTAPVLLDLGADQFGRVRTGAVGALTNQIRMGTFPLSLRPRLRQLIGALCAGSLDDARLARQLIVRLPEEDQAEGLALLRRRTAPAPSGTARSLPPPTAPVDLARFERAAQQATGLPSDPVLRRLLQEVHVHDRTELRHHACLLLMASPYRASLASVAAELLVERPGSPSSVSAAIMLSYLALPEHTDTLIELTRHPQPGVRQAALTAITHAAGVPADLDLLAASSTPDTPDAAARYAAGMGAHPSLPEWARSADMSTDVRERCRWWQRNGSAVRS
ncbi:hypothetical protein [Luteipulveratus mongoliensis]|uniref:Uncharacterized protein n=1 Tax=Luteipulveratus mongoliensis TaxID=571913 RepID=A0A0K1JJI1_9MICO|nr:hypothetical protein [Luteipulveratus mongoliensis]AKU16730.1 hypothetical protein VV02_14070 [Luteipulveratus mongoliensis]